MIEGFTLSEELISFEKGFENWEEAIVASSQGLLKQGFIEQSYVDSMISSVKEFGPYIVIAPNIAMPHARPETGSHKVGFAVMVCEEAVSFGDTPELQARLLITLSCVNADTHLKMLQELVMVLADEEKFNKILNSKTKEEILSIFK
jgi:mannitol/fructose-specific phosphotransferase system IIA component (Ntr-type)